MLYSNDFDGSVQRARDHVTLLLDHVRVMSEARGSVIVNLSIIIFPSLQLWLSNLCTHLLTFRTYCYYFYR